MNPNDPPGYPPPYQQPGYAAPGYGAPGYGAQGYAAQGYPQAYPPPGGPVQRPRSGQRRAMGFGVAGFAVAAIIAAILCVTGVMPVRGSGASVDSSAISLPSKLGRFVSYQDATRNQDAKSTRSVRHRQRSDRKTAAALSKAYDGAGAAVQTYTDQDLTNTFSVWAVRASSPGLVKTYADPKVLGVAAAPEAVQRFGAVRCVIVQTQTVPAGQKPRGAVATLCQRSADGLTVSFHVGIGVFARHPKRVVALVNQVWKLLG